MQKDDSIKTLEELQNGMFCSIGLPLTNSMKSDGTVWTWGVNEKGQLGLGDTDNRIAPTKVNIENVTKIAVSSSHVLALKNDGTVWGWEYVSLGALTDVGGSMPKQILGLDGTRMKNISSISSGYYSGLAITDEGKVLAWGSNGYGQLGNGTTTNTAIPAYVMESNENELNNIFIAQMGKNYSVFAKENGEVWATGYNEYGQLGNTSKATINMPENISNDYLSTDVLDLTFNTIGQTKKINTTYKFGFNLYNYGNQKQINYVSEDETIANVDENGNVTANGIGKTYIDITTGEYKKHTGIDLAGIHHTEILAVAASYQLSLFLKLSH